MPAVHSRRLYDDKPNGYLESLDDWYRNNDQAVEWFLQNAEELRAAIVSVPCESVDSPG